MCAVGMAVGESRSLESYARSGYGEFVAWVLALEVVADEDGYVFLWKVDAGSVGGSSLA